MAESLLQIGQLAELAGVSVDTGRYYERQQLLERAPRSRGGYRLFTPEAVERIRFIKQAQDVGLALDEIRALIPVGKTGLAECQNIRRILDAKLKELNTRLAQMRTLNSKASVSATETKLIVSVSGMTCSSCAFQIRTTLAKLPGVTSAEVSYEKGQAVIVYDPKAINDASIRTAITELGYEVGDSSKPAKATSAKQGRLASIETATLIEEFNRASDRVRVVAILSPTCGPCQRGRGVVGELFKKHESDKLRGFVVWLPMKPADSAQAAWTESEKLQDQRIIARGWDGKREIANLFANPLKLRKTTWDVYLLYAPGVRWEGNEPPAPTFWMHQLQEANQSLCLNPVALSNEVERLLTSEKGNGNR